MEGSLFNAVFLLLVFGIVSTLVHGQGTHVGFYSSTCSQAESIVKSVTPQFII